MESKERTLANPPESTVVYTLGHGGLSRAEFFAILRGAGIACVVDVRSYPMSRRHPFYSRPQLSAVLDEEGVAYRWLGSALGGFRQASPQSPHAALHGAGLRGYAEHMTGGVFLDGIEELLAHARLRRTAMLCAERLPRDCHRSLIADHLVARGVAVNHLIDVDHQAPHRLSALARSSAGRLIYDRGAAEQLDLEF